jgi:predicted dehydrogenase
MPRDPVQEPDRRTFLKTSTGLVTGAVLAARAEAAPAAPAVLRQPLGDKLRVAVIGCGGRGAENLRAVSAEHVAILCDVNTRHLEKAASAHPQARTVVDLRRVFDHPDAFDAVVVSTPEHTHAVAVLPALQLKKHVFCEKPLTHNVHEARVLREATAAAGVATQMGTQIHASENYRRVVELVQSGAIGRVSECHVWVSRAWGLQSEEDAKKNGDIVHVTERPSEVHPVPDGIEWDLWLGPAPARPYNDVYLPGPKWYRWWDFGNGTMSDLGSHWIDLPFWALKLQTPAPPSSRADRRRTPSSRRRRCGSRYEYAAMGDQPEVSLTWYQGRRAAGGAGRRASSRPTRAACCSSATAAMIVSDYGKHAVLLDDTVHRLPATRTLHSEVARAPCRVDPRLQDGRADDVQLRLLGAAHRGEPPGKRGVSRRPQARMGPRRHARDQRAGGRPVPAPRVPRGVEAVDVVPTGVSGPPPTFTGCRLRRLRSPSGLCSTACAHDFSACHALPLAAVCLLLAFVTAPALDAQDARTAAPDRFAIPATDDGLPGAGPIRRYDWFQKLWRERRSAVGGGTGTGPRRGGVPR